MSRKILWLLLPACVTAAGCSEATRINTTPPGAYVWINGHALGTAPVEFKVKSWSARRNAYHYHIEKPGYLEKDGFLQPHLSITRIVSAAMSWCLTCSFHGFYEFDEDTEIALQPDLPAPSSVDDDVERRLRRLQDLYDQKLISADELRQYKAEVLRDIVGPPPEPKREALPLPDVLRDLIGPILEAPGNP